MVKKVKCKIKGIVPIILHNGRLKNPRDTIVRELKKYTAKTKKTDSDLDKISELQWYGGIYINEDKKIIVPGMNIESMLVESAKKLRLGKCFQAGLFCDEDPVLKHDGPRELEKIFDDKKYVLEVTVKNRATGGSVLRTRPIFPVWELEFTLNFAEDVVNIDQVKQVIEDGGRLVGLCDWKPKFGRYDLIEFKEV